MSRPGATAVGVVLLATGLVIVAAVAVFSLADSDSAPEPAVEAVAPAATAKPAPATESNEAPTAEPKNRPNSHIRLSNVKTLVPLEKEDGKIMPPTRALIAEEEESGESK